MGVYAPQKHIPWTVQWTDLLLHAHDALRQSLCKRQMDSLLTCTPRQDSSSVCNAKFQLQDYMGTLLTRKDSMKICFFSFVRDPLHPKCHMINHSEAAIRQRALCDKLIH